VAKEQATTSNAIWQSMSQGLGTMANSLLTNWRNVGSALKGVLSSIGQTIIQEVVNKPLMAKIAAWAKEKLLTTAGIGADAAKAGSGAAASQASIPYIGPVLALAAMATVFAGVMGMSSKVSSASGGFDIPRGVNPMTQLHSEEMVLPASLSNAVRRMAAGDEQSSGGSGGSTFHINVTAMDAAGVRQFFLGNQAALVDALKNANRNGMR